MPLKQPTWRDVVIPLVLGIWSLTIVIARPRFAAMARVDVLELVASGVMFGLALRAASMLLHRND